MPNIYTVHDIIPLLIPNSTGIDRAKYRRLLEKVIKRSDQIAVVSESTRRDLIVHFSVDEDRITTTYQSVTIHPSHLDRSITEASKDVETFFRIGWKDYFLYVGNIEPKKNIARIIYAYIESKTKTPLVIVGKQGWAAENEYALLNKFSRESDGLPGRILHLEYLEEGMLVTLIRGAKAMVFPSLYEGFGLPVLESMTLGTAVLTSTSGALPEVAGDAAIIVDPYDVRALRRGLQALDEDDGLRAELVAAGFRQAQKFSPEAYRARLFDLYAKVGVSK